MREILFRAKAINRDTGYHRTKYENGDWVYGLIIKPHYDDFPTIPMEMRNTDGIDGIDVDYKTVGQFTGLTDKNGTKIFEGDIIADYFGRIYGVVKYGEGHFDGGVYKYTGFFVETKDIFYDGNIFDESNTDYWNSHKVIGNIHDNPELLEVKE